MIASERLFLLKLWSTRYLFLFSLPLLWPGPRFELQDSPWRLSSTSCCSVFRPHLSRRSFSSRWALWARRDPSLSSFSPFCQRKQTCATDCRTLQRILSASSSATKIVPWLTRRRTSLIRGTGFACSERRSPPANLATPWWEQGSRP